MLRSADSAGREFDTGLPVTKVRSLVCAYCGPSSGSADFTTRHRGCQCRSQEQRPGRHDYPQEVANSGPRSRLAARGQPDAPHVRNLAVLSDQW